MAKRYRQSPDVSGTLRLLREQLALWYEPSPVHGYQRKKHFASKRKVLGQFFTPPEVAAFMCSLASSLTDKQLAIDPACGDGVFLAAFRIFGLQKVVGEDIDEEAMSQIRLGSGGELCHCDALIGLWEFEGQASLLAGNPPFSAKYGRVEDARRLRLYELGWSRKSQATEVLFCEKFIRLAKSKGAIAIILPEGFFASIPFQYARDYLLSHLRIKAIVSLSPKIFKLRRAKEVQSFWHQVHFGSHRDPNRAGLHARGEIRSWNYDGFAKSLKLQLGKVDIRQWDARNLPLSNESVDGIITSPTYSIALDYVANDAHALLHPHFAYGTAIKELCAKVRRKKKESALAVSV